jgi:hypothetical protein
MFLVVVMISKKKKKTIMFIFSIKNMKSERASFQRIENRQP